MPTETTKSDLVPVHLVAYEDDADHNATQFAQEYADDLTASAPLFD